MGLQQLSRHLSFPVSPGGNAVAAAAVAAVSTPVLQYTTSSSLQVGLFGAVVVYAVAAHRC